MALSLRRHIPIVVQFVIHNCFSTFVFAFTVLEDLFRPFNWLLFNLVVWEQTLVFFCIPILFCRIDIRENANNHKVISYKYLSNSIWTVVKEFCQGYFCLRHSFLATYFYLVSWMAQKVWRLLVSVFVHDRYSHAGNCTGLPSNTGLFLSTGSMYLFILQRHFIPFDS